MLHPYYQEILPECHHYKALSICHNLLKNKGVCDNNNQVRHSVEDVQPCHFKMKIIYCLSVVYSNNGWSPLSNCIITRPQPSAQKCVAKLSSITNMCVFMIYESWMNYSKRIIFSKIWMLSWNWNYFILINREGGGVEILFLWNLKRCANKTLSSSFNWDCLYVGKTC